MVPVPVGSAEYANRPEQQSLMIKPQLHQPMPLRVKVKV